MTVRRAVRICQGVAISGLCFGSCLPALPEVADDDVVWREVDGGADYYAQFSPTLPDDEGYFPTGVWLESIRDRPLIDLDRAAGITTYVDVTEDSELDQLAGTGMVALRGRDDPLADGFVLADEPDMWAGAGDAGWTGAWPGQDQDICVPVGEDAACGYTIQSTIRAALPADGLVYANYGKGVAFWQSDEHAARFVNEFQDVVSVDTYWFTDPYICGPGEGGTLLAGGRELTPEECRRAANYGKTVDRVRSLVQPPGRIPVWAFVELGHPFPHDEAPTITGPQVRAAVWSSIIHGARGIVYFNHSFGGDCESFHLLREACGDAVRPWVTEVNRQLTELAPALDGPFLDGALTVTGEVDTAVKVDGDDQVLLAASTATGPTEATFDLVCARDGTVTVLGEDRELTMSGGVFTDTFADADAVHLYRYAHAADASPGCVAP